LRKGLRTDVGRFEKGTKGPVRGGGRSVFTGEGSSIRESDKFKEAKGGLINWRKSYTLPWGSEILYERNINVRNQKEPDKEASGG